MPLETNFTEIANLTPANQTFEIIGMLNNTQPINATIHGTWAIDVQSVPYLHELFLMILVTMIIQAFALAFLFLILMKRTKVIL